MSRAPRHATDAILEFGEIEGDLLAEVGGKAGNLGELYTPTAVLTTNVRDPRADRPGRR